MMKGLLHRIALLFSKDAREADRDVRGLEQTVGKDRLQRLAEYEHRLSPVLTGSIQHAANIASQSVNVLSQKERLAEKLERMAEKWQKASSEASGSRPVHENELCQHLRTDIQRIAGMLRQERTHDLEPMLAKANHLVKIINLEQRAGAVNPTVLKEFEVYERSLLKKIAAAEHLAKELQADEFKAIRRFIYDLKQESAALDLAYRTSRQRSVKKRMQQIIAERLMLENILQMACVETVEQAHLHTQALAIYDTLEWLSNVHEKEQGIIKP